MALKNHVIKPDYLNSSKNVASMIFSNVSISELNISNSIRQLQLSHSVTIFKVSRWLRNP